MVVLIRTKDGRFINKPVKSVILYRDNKGRFSTSKTTNKVVLFKDSSGKFLPKSFITITKGNTSSTSKEGRSFTYFRASGIYLKPEFQGSPTNFHSTAFLGQALWLEKDGSPLSLNQLMDELKFALSLSVKPQIAYSQYSHKYIQGVRYQFENGNFKDTIIDKDFVNKDY